MYKCTVADIGRPVVYLYYIPVHVLRLRQADYSHCQNVPVVERPSAICIIATIQGQANQSSIIWSGGVIEQYLYPGYGSYCQQTRFFIFNITIFLPIEGVIVDVIVD